ncbi:MAG: TonB family protein, partial [Sphingomonadaceae bacterium]
EQEGPGSGSGGIGDGPGSGASGSDLGGGGLAVPAQRVAGAISGATDYPPESKRAGIEGSVAVRYTVGIDGRVSGCRVVRSSADAAIDAATCRLIEERFRYRPARDRAGRPVPQLMSKIFDWLLPSRS